MKYELNRKQIKALYDFAQIFDFGDLHDILKIVLFPILIAINSIIQLRDNKEDD